MNVLMLLRSELRRSAAVLAGIAAVLALAIDLDRDRHDRQDAEARLGPGRRPVRSSHRGQGQPSSLLLGTVFLRDEPLPSCRSPS